MPEDNQAIKDFYDSSQDFKIIFKEKESDKEEKIIFANILGKDNLFLYIIFPDKKKKSIALRLINSITVKSDD